MTENKLEPVTAPESLERALARIRKAQAVYATYTQSQVDRISIALN